MATVGPNAVIQLGEALALTGDHALARRIYAQAGVVQWLHDPPTAMVDEVPVAQLFKAVTDCMTRDAAISLFTEAGHRTGRYILRHRIPAPARALLPRLPASLAVRLLLAAISKHAWTFAGTGTFSHRTKRGTVEMSIANNPLSTAVGCPWHCAVFETLLNALLRVQIRVIESTCTDPPSSNCVFTCSMPRFHQR